MTGPVVHDEQGPIRQVREGMRVLDATGDEVGTVALVQMGDGGATTTQGQAGEGGGLLSSLGELLSGGSRLTPQARERLVRLGYLRVDRSGLLSGAAYAEATAVERVEGDTVHLSLRGDQLLAD